MLDFCSEFIQTLDFLLALHFPDLFSVSEFCLICHNPQLISAHNTVQIYFQVLQSISLVFIFK